MRSASANDMLSTLVVGREEPGFPRVFGKFELLERIGAGGMAEVFRALTRGAEGFEKEVCIKRILPMFTEDADFVSMFKDEATLASKLQHANIVQILDFDVAEGQYYIAMEFVEGRDLKRVLQGLKNASRPMPIGVGAFIGGEILKGLHYAHTRRHSGQALGIIHRDISPHNVLVSMCGEVKITDFGIAKAASRVSATRSGVVKGKILYMSPEQASGGSIDHRADLFAAGVVLYEVLTGLRPFAADSDAESLARIARGQFTPARQVRPDIPERLDAVICKLLAKEREDRYATGADALRDLGVDVPADGAMQLGDVMTLLVEGPVAVSRRVVTEVLDIEKPRPVAMDAPVVPAESGAVTRTRGPREEPEAIAFLDTKVATPTRSAAERASVGSEFIASVPTVVSGPPEMAGEGGFPLTAVHIETDILAAAKRLGLAGGTAAEVKSDTLAPQSSPTAPETPGSRGAARREGSLLGAPTSESTPAAWSFSAERTDTGHRTRSRARGPAAALVAGVAIALAVAGYLALREGGPDGTTTTYGTSAPAPGPAVPQLPQLQPLAAPPGIPSATPAAGPTTETQPAPTPAPAAATHAPAQASPTKRPRGAAAAKARGPAKAASGRNVAAAVERAQAVTPPAAPEPPRLGRITVNAQPWAHVKINGRPAGDTPVVRFQVPAGTVRIVLEREGRDALTRTVAVGPGEERSVSYPFP